MEEQQDGLEERLDLKNTSRGSPKPQASPATYAPSNYSADYKNSEVLLQFMHSLASLHLFRSQRLMARAPDWNPGDLIYFRLCYQPAGEL